jgi:hypothetical protein
MTQSRKARKARISHTIAFVIQRVTELAIALATLRSSRSGVLRAVSRFRLRSGANASSARRGLLLLGESASQPPRPV